MSIFYNTGIYLEGREVIVSISQKSYFQNFLKMLSSGVVYTSKITYMYYIFKFEQNPLQTRGVLTKLSNLFAGSKWEIGKFSLQNNIP